MSGTAEIPSLYTIGRYPKGGFFIARTDVPIVEEDNIEGMEIVPRRNPYRTEKEAKTGLQALAKRERLESE